VHGHVRTAWSPKQESTLDEYEDALAVRPHPGATGAFAGPHLRVAVADGASESFLAREWASRLVQTCTRRRQWGLEPCLRRAVADWELLVQHYVEQRVAAARPLRWYEEIRLAQGAFATLLVLDLRAADGSGGGTWRTSAVGDVCVFQVRGDRCIAAVPLDGSQAFDLQPLLVPSKPPSLPALVDEAVRHGGRWEAEDRFYLATDALSAWFLRTTETDGAPWSLLDELLQADGPDPDRFTAWVTAERASGRLRDDDVTLVRLEMC
jgi:hypothetical protein